jgi:hypothetical protein
MSKILKVVGDRHHIEGGVKCLSCEGKGRRMVQPIYGKPNIKERCPFCSGTGVQAVELWPDARKAEWLRANAPIKVLGRYRKKRPINPDQLIIRVDLYTSVYEWEIVYIEDYRDGPEEAELAADKDKSKALTAAVIAVAEEE